MKTEKKIKRGGNFLLYGIKLIQSIADGFYIVGTIFIGLFLVGFTFTLGLPLLAITLLGVGLFATIVFVKKVMDEQTLRQALVDELLEQEEAISKLFELLDEKKDDPVLRDEQINVIQWIANSLSEVSDQDVGKEKNRKERIKQAIIKQLTDYMTSNDLAYKEKIKTDIIKQIRQSNTNTKKKLFTVEPIKGAPIKKREGFSIVRAGVGIIRDALQVSNALRGVVRAIAIKVNQFVKSPYTKAAIAAAGIVSALVFGGVIAIGLSIFMGVTLIASGIITAKSEKKVEDKIETVASENRVLSDAIINLESFQRAGELVRRDEAAKRVNEASELQLTNLALRQESGVLKDRVAAVQEENRLLRLQLSTACDENQPSMLKTVPGHFVQDIQQNDDKEKIVVSERLEAANGNEIIYAERKVITIGEKLKKNFSKKEELTNNLNFSEWQNKKQDAANARHRRQPSSPNFFVDSYKQPSKAIVLKQASSPDLSRSL